MVLKGLIFCQSLLTLGGCVGLERTVFNHFHFRGCGGPERIAIE